MNGWDSVEPLLFFLRKSIPKEYGYVEYEYPNEILTSDPIKTRECFKYLIDTMKIDLKNMNDLKPRKFYFYGQSLGGLFCMIVSDEIKTEKEMLTVPGSNLAEAFWQGTGTYKIKEEMVEKHNITLEELKELWKDISPDYYFKKESLNTKFNIILSKNDTVIPTENGKKLLGILDSKNIKYDLHWTSLGHRMASIREPIFHKRFTNWLKNIEK